MIKLETFEARGRGSPLNGRRFEAQFEPGMHAVGINERGAAARLINSLYSLSLLFRGGPSCYEFQSLPSNPS
jgi:hypothetical protein